MKLFVIGGTGQLGSAIVKDALSLGYEVISPTRHEFNINDELEFWRIIVDNLPDVVINTAALNDTTLCESKPLDAFEYNCFAVRNMAKMSNYLDIPFITFSTDYVFDGLKNKPYVETDLPFPLQTYGLSKLAGEYASLIYDTTTVIRTSTLYGLKSLSTKGGKGNFIDSIIKESKRSNNVKVGIDKIVSSTNAEDLSKAVLKLITHPCIREHQEEESKVYHLVNESFCSIFDLTKEIFNTIGINTTLIPTKYDAKLDKIKRPLFSALKNQRAKKLGIRLPYWKDALKRYLEIKYKDDLK